MFFLSGVRVILFVPMAEAVVFAMLASYLLSRTVVPTMARYLLKEHDDEESGEGMPAAIPSSAFNKDSRAGLKNSASATCVF